MRFSPFLAVALLLVFLWFSGFLMLHIAGALLHLVLLLAVASLFIHLFAGRRPARRRERLL